MCPRLYIISAEGYWKQPVKKPRLLNQSWAINIAYAFSSYPLVIA